MKKIITLLFLLASICSYGQKKPILDGIFDLRLGMSKEELFAVIDTTEIRGRRFLDLEATDYANRVEEIVIHQYVSTISGQPQYTYILHIISIKFLDDKAYDINLADWNNTLEEMLMKKYGKPKKKGKLKTKTEKEYKPYAERTSEFDEVKNIKVTTISDTRRKVWKTGDKNIECESKELSYDTSMYYHMVDKEIQKEVGKRDAIKWERYKEKRAEEEKEKEERAKKEKENIYDAL